MTKEFQTKYIRILEQRIDNLHCAIHKKQNRVKELESELSELTTHRTGPKFSLEELKNILRAI